MLQANELRIGNWVDDAGYYQQIHFTDIADLSTGCGGAHLYKPIVLTPDILENAGFKEQESLADGFSWYLKDDVAFSLPYFSFSWDDGRVDLKYLHQLQNLYFALTGTELNINL